MVVGVQGGRGGEPFWECERPLTAAGAERSLLQMVAVGTVAPGCGKTNRF